MEQRTCRACGEPFTPLGKRGPKRTVCYQCRPAPLGSRVVECVGCSQEFYISGRRGSTRKFCSEACRYRTRDLTPPTPRRCQLCGMRFFSAKKAQRFCRVECRYQDAQNIQRRKVRDAWRNRPPCVTCGGRIPDGVNMNATACSPLCRSRRDAKNRTSPKHGSPEQRREYNRRYRERNPDKFVWNDTKKAAYHRRRARKKTGSAGERIVSRQVFERDGWRCGCCGKRVNPNLAWPHPKSASLDHIVPLSKGGTHTLANVQCAHLDCNTKKRDNIGGAGDQLRLIG